MLMRTDPMTVSTPEAGSDKLRPAVQLDGVTKRFGNSVALHEAWLKIRPSEFMTLLGPSGCGKTTLLNLVAGFLEADNGEIFIDGELVTETPAHMREIGIVFQNYALFPHMSVAKNIAYGLKTRGVDKKEIVRRVDEALALVKLTGFADRKPRQLSGGQQQRVALARALVIKPKVLLLDEPFSALDKNLRGSMQVELKQIQRELGVTTIFVTHDQGEALSMSDRIAVMSAGRILQIAAPDDIYRRPADRFVASFVGDANILNGRLVEKRGDVAVVSVGDIQRPSPCSTDRGTVGWRRRGYLCAARASCRGTARGIGIADRHRDDAGVSGRPCRSLYRCAWQRAGVAFCCGSPGIAALSSCPVGAENGLTIGSDDIVAFPPGEAP